MLGCWRMLRALLVVDMQRGLQPLFCPDEPPVPGGLETVPQINCCSNCPVKRIRRQPRTGHPPDHCSFLCRRDNLYPPHCVIGILGAEFLPGLRTDRFHAVLAKGL